MTSVVDKRSTGVFKNWIKLWTDFKRNWRLLWSSDIERVKCGVLDGADVHSFDAVIFVSVVIRRHLGSVHIQITSWIKYLLILSISTSAVPSCYLGTNTNGITVNSHNRKCITVINIWLPGMIASFGYKELWFLVHWCRFERLTTTVILQRIFVTSLPSACKSFIFSLHFLLFPGLWAVLVEQTEQCHWS